ncbi:GumC family protein [Marinisporobacter balticus]|uniref:Uncharacterized protein involved in exopolysaccharide biosynthesis n=1 Tax=Marinisporobacter balticus TaxID=2018667 RepID=A0A4R2L0W2_9FIRM|nr:Wzz/FepE/Etk N-terminal domain-containing protein [Marinisporobacter balticus]TCO78817.1 uncharacterized protein involved in exopolysaccharide biosynthesis [Marinisporobacter balticus]
MEQQNQYDEISLRELIEALLRQRKLIIGVTLACLLTSFVVSFFILDPVYESKATLIASGISKQLTQQEEGVKGFLDGMVQYPEMSIETYKQQINNPHVLQQTIDELKLDQLKITRRSLQNMVSLENIKDTNLININVTYTDKKVATDIANTIAKKFTEFVSNNANIQYTKSSDFMKGQLGLEKENLDQVLVEYKNYMAKPRGKNELEKEVDSKLELITKYKTDLVDAQIQEKKISAALSVAENALTNTPDKMTLKKALSDDAYLAQVIKDDTGKDAKELYGVQVTTEETNEAYIELRKQIDLLKIELAKTSSAKNNLKNLVSSMQKELENLQVNLAEKQHEEQTITQKVEIAQNTYNAFVEKFEETRIAKSSTIGDLTISVLSAAVEPLEPVGPRKMLNMAIAGVLGIMMGVFLAFAREYWKSSAVTNKKVA